MEKRKIIENKDLDEIDIENIAAVDTYFYMKCFPYAPIETFFIKREEKNDK